MIQQHNALADPLSPYWRAKVETAFSGQPPAKRRARGVTAAQAEVLFLLALGFTGAQIGRHRSVTRSTIYQIRNTAVATLRGAAR